jgi:hypothetical protein
MSQFVSAAAGAPSDLTDAERAALLQLAVDAVAESDGISLKAAADLLDRAAATGDAHLAGDAHHVSVTIHGRALVAISRADLAALLIDEDDADEDLTQDELDAMAPHYQAFDRILRSHGLDRVADEDLRRPAGAVR